MAEVRVTKYIGEIIEAKPPSINVTKFIGETISGTPIINAIRATKFIGEILSVHIANTGSNVKVPSLGMLSSRRRSLSKLVFIKNRTPNSLRNRYF